MTKAANSRAILIPLIIYGWVFLSVWWFESQFSDIFFACLIEIWVLVLLLIALRLSEVVWNWRKLGFVPMLTTFLLRSPNLLPLAWGTGLLTLFQWLLMGILLQDSNGKDISLNELMHSLFSGSLRWVVIVSLLVYVVVILQEKGFTRKNKSIGQSFLFEVVAFFVMNLSAIVLVITIGTHTPLLLVFLLMVVRFVTGIVWDRKTARM
jgi:hypothetical protein